MTTQPQPVVLPEITDEMVWRATNTYTRGNHSDEGMRAALTEFRGEAVMGDE